MNKLFLLFAALFMCVSGVSSQNRILISKQKLRLWVISQKNDTLFTARVGVGQKFGNKTKSGDMKTPEGTFRIIQIQDASQWTHDFNDGHGQRKNAYGPFFIRLDTPVNKSIGIHGTCFPESIGTRCSEGCVRMLNDDVRTLRRLVRKGDKCTILPDA